MTEELRIVSIDDNEGNTLTFEVVSEAEEKLLHDMVRIAGRYNADVGLVMVYLTSMQNVWTEIIHSQNDIGNSDERQAYDYANTLVIRDIALRELRLDRLAENFGKWIEAHDSKN